MANQDPLWVPPLADSRDGWHQDTLPVAVKVWSKGRQQGTNHSSIEERVEGHIFAPAGLQVILANHKMLKEKAHFSRNKTVDDLRLYTGNM